jgi:hypothetical protein
MSDDAATLERRESVDFAQAALSHAQHRKHRPAKRRRQGRGVLRAGCVFARPAAPAAAAKFSPSRRAA